MMTNYRVMNKLVCVNFTKETMNWINKIIPDRKPNNVNFIHILVYDTTKIDVKKLIVLAKACKEKKIKCFVHCFNSTSKNIIKALIASEQTDDENSIISNKFKHFAVNHEHMPMRFGYSNGKYMDVTYREIKITTPTKNGTKVDTIRFNYKRIIGEKDTCTIETV